MNHAEDFTVYKDKCYRIKHIPDNTTDEELFNMGLIRCFHPRINETHLADYILIPIEQSYEYTKELYQKAKDDLTN